MMGIIDKVLASVAPVMALRRAQARAALRHYEAADQGRRLGNRRRVGGDANASLVGKQLPSAEAARDLVRNNAWAARALAGLVNNAIGYGITSEPKHPNKIKARRLRDAFTAWAGSRNVSATRQLDWFGTQAVGFRSIAEGGACFVLETTAADGDLSLQLMEREFLDESRGTRGIDYDSRGAPVTYYLYDQHPGDTTGGMVRTTSTAYPASRVAHVYRIDRLGQRDGITWFAPVAMDLHDLDGYEDATLMKQKVAACFAGFVEQGGSSLGAATPTGVTISDKIEPGALELLPPGSKITFPNAPTNSDYSPFVQARLRRIAAGLGMSYEALTGDLSEVNFSSGRMGWQEFQRNIDGWQWQMFIPMFVSRVCEWWLRRAVARGIISEQDAAAVTWEHTPPRRTVVDPSREYPALRDAVRAGLVTFPEALRELGKTFDQHAEEMQFAQSELDRLGLVVESDARRAVGSANADTVGNDPTQTQGAAQNGAA